jgi:hypothetical protein
MNPRACSIAIISSHQRGGLFFLRGGGPARLIQAKRYSRRAPGPLFRGRSLCLYN